MDNRRVLVIEDDPDITEIIEYNLSNEGFDVVCAADGEHGLREAEADKPALVLLDLMLPGMPGLEVCRRLRAGRNSRDVPIIIVTAKGEEADTVAGLEVGADDYVTKPFRIRELVARVNAVLRRTAEERISEEDRVERNGIVIDMLRHEVSIDGEPVELTLAEFRLLAALARQPGRVLARARLVHQITAGGYQVSERNVDVHMAALRRKLGDHAAPLVTVRGIGYKFKEDDGA